MKKYYVIQLTDNCFFWRFFGYYNQDKKKREINIIGYTGLIKAKRFLKKESAEALCKRLKKINEKLNPVIRTVEIRLKKEK